MFVLTVVNQVVLVTLGCNVGVNGGTIVVVDILPAGLVSREFQFSLRRL